MSKGLKALKSLFDTMPFAFLESNTMKELIIIEKELKALEIIKNNCDVQNIIAFCVNNEKERDLLKEFLSYDD